MPPYLVMLVTARVFRPEHRGWASTFGECKNSPKSLALVARLFLIPGHSIPRLPSERRRDETLPKPVATKADHNAAPQQDRTSNQVGI